MVTALHHVVNARFDALRKALYRVNIFAKGDTHEQIC